MLTEPDMRRFFLISARMATRIPAFALNMRINEIYEELSEIPEQSDPVLEMLINAAVEMLDALTQYTREGTADIDRACAIERVPPEQVRAAPARRHSKSA
jgi:hypothetical protein